MQTVRKKLRRMFKHSHSGSVMVEFALCLPFIITLLYVVVDAYNYYYWSNKVKNCTYIVAGLLQNAYKKQEGTDKTGWYKKGLEPSDVKNICKAAMLSLPIPSDVMSAGLADKAADVSKYPVPIICIMCVRGADDGDETIQMLWELDYQLGQQNCFYSGNGKPSCTDDPWTGKVANIRGLSPGTHYFPGNFRGLSVSAGEEKILIYTYIEPNDYEQVRKYFGLYLISPSLNKFESYNSKTAGYFLNMLVFTPAPGLFSEKIYEGFYDVVAMALPSDPIQRSKFISEFGSKVPVACSRSTEYPEWRQNNLRSNYGLSDSQIKVLQYPSGY